MSETKHIQIKDFNYSLPDERIAKFPLSQRDSSKLLLYNKGKVSEDTFRNLPQYLPEGALMVFNNTRVIQARLHFRKKTEQPTSTQQGALIEIFLLEPAAPAEYQENFIQRGQCSWYCLVGNLKKWKGGKLSREMEIDGKKIVLTAERKGIHGTSHRIDFEWNSETCPETNPPSWAELLEAIGELPIPPYLNRDAEESDKTTYQTVYSKIKGSVAAPTAGLHFTDRVLAELDARKIDREEVTLHVGAGTFKPVKSEEIGGHDMHTEHIAVHKQTLEKLIHHAGEAIAVGTTSVRTLESLYYMGLKAEKLMTQGTDTGEAEELLVTQWEPYEGNLSETDSETAIRHLLTYMEKHKLEILHSSTQIIIAPGYRYHIVKMMVTNFHQPQSTLLLLVSAFVNGDWHKIYDYALAHGFRFLSYGDSSLLIP